MIRPIMFDPCGASNSLCAVCWLGCVTSEGLGEQPGIRWQVCCCFGGSERVELRLCLQVSSALGGASCGLEVLRRLKGEKV